MQIKACYEETLDAAASTVIFGNHQILVLVKSIVINRKLVTSLNMAASMTSTWTHDHQISGDNGG